MKALDKDAARIMEAILGAGKTVINNSRGAYPPVHVALSRWSKGYRTISISQVSVYGEDASPCVTAMMFLHSKQTGEYVPFGYRNDFAGVSTQSVVMEKGVPVVLDEALQRDHADFAAVWLSDISFKHWLAR